MPGTPPTKATGRAVLARLTNACIWLGMALLAPSWLIVFKLAAIWLFLFLTGPTGSHALANAAHTAGLQPVIGRQRDRAGESDSEEAS